MFARSLASGQRIALQLDHDDGTVAASTANGLELAESDVGLLFRLDMRRARNASAIHSIVDGNNRACVSVSYAVEQERIETFAGHKIRVITQASLRELSLVRRGVAEEAFAFVTDDVSNPSIAQLEAQSVNTGRKLGCVVLDGASRRAGGPSYLIYGEPLLPAPRSAEQRKAMCAARLKQA